MLFSDIHCMSPETYAHSPPRIRKVAEVLTPSGTSPQEAEPEGPIRPDELLLALLECDERLKGEFNQKALARATLLSQPTVSRLLSTLYQRGHVTSHVPAPWEGRHAERTYRLTPKGETFARALWTKLQEYPTPDPLLTLRDLIDLHPNIPPADLLLLCLRRTPFDVEDPSSALRHLDRMWPDNARPTKNTSSSDPFRSEHFALVGRIRERRRLLSLLRNVMGSHVEPSSVVLLGQAGIGKSTLLRFTVRAAEARGFQVRRGQVVSEGRLPLYLLGGFLDTAEGRSLRVAGRVLPPLMVSMLEHLELDARKRPQLFVIDDLHLATADDLVFLEFLLFGIMERKMPVVAVFAMREDNPQESPSEGILERIQTLGRTGTGLLQLERLPPLAPEEAHLLAQQAMGVRALHPGLRPLLQRLEERARGNPLFLLESIEFLRQRGLLDPARLGEVETLPVPDSLRRLISARMARLPEPSRRLLEMAATIGPRFDLDAIAHLAWKSGWGDRKKVLAELARSVKEGEFLESGSVGEFVFRHPLLPDVLQEETRESERYHRILAEWWGERRPLEIETVAFHCFQGRDDTLGILWVRKALRAALREPAPEKVERYHRWLQALLEQRETPIEARVQEGLGVFDDLCEMVEFTPQGRRILSSLLAGHPPEALRWEIETRQAIDLVTTDPPMARKKLARLAKEIPPGRSRAGTRGFLLAIGRTRLANSDGRVRVMIKEASPLLRPRKGLPVWIRAQALYNAGRAWTNLAQPQRIRWCITQARALARTHESPYLQGLCSNLEASLAHTEGRVRPLRIAFEDALANARLSGDPDQVARRILNVGLACIMEGDLVKARQMLEEYRRFAERMGATKEEGMEQYLEGWLLLHEGHSGEAVDLLRQAREIMNQAGRTYLLESVQVRMIDALLTQGDVEGARRELRSATYGGELMRMQEGWCCALESQTVRARRFLEQAVKEALSHRHLLTHGLALKHLARWEEGFGKRKRAQALFRKAQKQFDRSGVIPGSWYWEWPPSFVKKSATSLALRRPTVPTERRHGSPS